MFGKAKTYAGEKLETENREATGDYSENALIVSDTLWAYLLRDGNEVRIIFRPSKRRENSWKITESTKLELMGQIPLLTMRDW